MLLCCDSGMEGERERRRRRVWAVLKPLFLFCYQRKCSVILKVLMQIYFFWSAVFLAASNKPSQHFCVCVWREARRNILLTVGTVLKSKMLGKSFQKIQEKGRITICHGYLSDSGFVCTLSLRQFHSKQWEVHILFYLCIQSLNHLSDCQTGTQGSLQ